LELDSPSSIVTIRGTNKNSDCREVTRYSNLSFKDELLDSIAVVTAQKSPTR